MIKAARAKGKYVEICKGHLDLFMDQGIHSRPRPPDLAVPEQVSDSDFLSVWEFTAVSVWG